MSKTSNGRYVFCQYADDIRQEMGNKISMMGIYQGGMHVTGPVPQQLPKLVISSIFNTPVEQRVENISVDVILNEEVLQNVTPPQESLREMQDAAHKSSDAKMLSMQMVFVMQPFPINGSGKLRVRIVADGEIFDSNALQIEVIDTHPH